MYINIKLNVLMKKEKSSQKLSVITDEMNVYI